MKKLLLLFLAAVMAVGVMAEVYPTKFLGIPIDGTKQEMILKIQEKGFSYDQEHDCLVGQFNGADVIVVVATNKDKVWRVMVMEKAKVPAILIRKKYNNLMQQFKDNPKYLSGHLDQDFIPENEDIAYEMTVHNKEYKAYFLQITHDLDSTQMYRDAIELNSKMLSNYVTPSQDDSAYIAMLASYFGPRLQYAQNPVWIQITEFYGGYSLAIYYDNNYNAAHGEDL